MRGLVLYFSKTGNTALVADTIRKTYKIHIQEIHDFTNYRSLIEYVLPTIFDSACIDPRRYNMNYYDTIFIGTPVWAASVTPAIYKFIKENDFQDKNIVLFNTMKKIGGKNAIRKLAKYVKKSNGNIIGAFSIQTDTDEKTIITNTKKALKELNI